MFDFMMNGVFVAIVAHGLIGLSLLWDKVLLRQPQTRNLYSYVFWLGAISIFGLLLIPFGFSMPPLWVTGLALAAGILQLAASFFYYGALKYGEASETLAIMGGFSPVATALAGVAFLPNPIGRHGMLSFALMVAGGFVMFFSEKVSLKRALPYVLLASGLFGLVNVMEKLVFDQVNFVSGYVFFTVGTFLGSMALLVRADWREQIFKNSGSAEPRSKAFYMVNRFTAGVGSFLVYFAISRENPAIVDAIAAVRYVIVFLGAYLITRIRPDWLRENFRGLVLLGKSLATALVVSGLVLLGLQGTGMQSGPV